MYVWICMTMIIYAETRVAYSPALCFIAMKQCLSMKHKFHLAWLDSQNS